MSVRGLPFGFLQFGCGIPFEAMNRTDKAGYRFIASEDGVREKTGVLCGFGIVDVLTLANSGRSLRVRGICRPACGHVKNR
jgi:hypothetical protein